MIADLLNNVDVLAIHPQTVDHIGNAQSCLSI